MEAESSPLTFRWLSEILEDPDVLEPPKATAPRLAWKGRLTLLAAREKGGKSTLAGAAAAAVSSGRTFLGEPCEAGNVLIVSLEESTGDFSRRLVDFGADPSRIAVLDQMSYDSAHMTLVEAIWEAAENVSPDLIIWDTLGAFANIVSGKSTLDPGDGPGWTRVMHEILGVARAYGASILLHHARKSDGKYRDSSAIGANVDVILEMRGEGSDPRVIKGVGRGLDIKEVRIRFEDNEFQLLQTSGEIQEAVKEFILKHPRCSWKDLREGISSRSTEVQKARDTLLKKGEILNVGSAGSHAYMVVSR